MFDLGCSALVCILGLKEMEGHKTAAFEPDSNIGQWLLRHVKHILFYFTFEI